jgi:hypothetical protein
VYVLNSKGDSPNITGFRLDVNGHLQWMATVDLPSGSTGANDIRFARDGSELLVTLSATNQILVFRVANDGTAGNPIVQASAGNSPFGIRFGHNSDAIISEAAGSVSSYQLTGADMLSVISGAVTDTQKAGWLKRTIHSDSNPGGCWHLGGLLEDHYSSWPAPLRSRVPPACTMGHLIDPQMD